MPLCKRNAVMKKIYDEYLSLIKNDYQNNLTAARKEMDYLRTSPVAYHGRCVYTLQIPKVFTETDVKRFDLIVNTTYRIFTKVINAYKTDPAYRASFPFPKELEELILTPSGYECPLPIARFDIFYNEDTGDFKFCEINTDGTSAMLEDYILNKAAHMNPAHEYMSSKYRFESWELFDSWVNAFFDIYSTYDKKVSDPYVAIVDFLEGGSVTEFDEFKTRFEKSGHRCEVCEITQLTYHDGKLFSPSGNVIDVIYRRAVTSDIMKRIDEVPAFVNAVKDRNVCIIGAFQTQIIHNKWLFKTLHDESTLALMTDNEKAFIKAHIPYTNLLSKDTCNIKELIATKDKWLIKPLDSYASKGVYAGCDLTAAEWKKHLHAALDNGYIYQEYCPPYRTKNICFVDKDPVIEDYTNMSGLFVYNGEFSGVYSRLSDGGIISSQYNERSVPSLKLMGIK